MRSLSFTLVAIAFITLTVGLGHAFNCSIPPIYVDIHNRAVQDSDLFQYGAFIGFGTPGQNLSLWPSFSRNETAIAATDYCTPSSPQDCQNNTHGFFEPVLSKSDVSLPNYSSFDTSLDQVTTTYLRDTMYLYTHFIQSAPASATTCTAVPFSLLSNSTANSTPSFFGPGGIVGLGPSSTSLEQLYANNIITSRSFSLYLGCGYDRCGGAANGSIVYGGYDSGRFTGPVHNYTVSPLTSSETVAAGETPLQVTVSQISLDLPTSDPNKNRTIDLLDSGAEFTASISPAQYPLTLPRAVTQSFANLFSAFPSTLFSSDDSLALPARFNGTMTITLSDGFSVIFPPEMMANVSNLTPISAGPLANTNNTSTNNTSGLPDDPEIYVLGAAFLALTYLSVNYDSEPVATFNLARAVPLNAVAVMQQPLCPDTGPSPYVPPDLSVFQRSGLTGVIVACVVLGSVGSVAVWICLRKRKRTRTTRASASKSARFAAAKDPDAESDCGSGYLADTEHWQHPAIRADNRRAGDASNDAGHVRAQVQVPVPIPTPGLHMGGMMTLGRPQEKEDEGEEHGTSTGAQAWPLRSGLASPRAPSRPARGGAEGPRRPPPSRLASRPPSSAPLAFDPPPRVEVSAEKAAADGTSLRGEKGKKGWGRR